MTEKDSVDGEPVEVAHYPVHLVQETSEVLAPSRRFDPLQLFNRPDPRMIQVGSVYDRGPLDDWDASNDVSKLDNLLDATVNIARVGHGVDDDIAIKFDNESHVPRA